MFHLPPLKSDNVLFLQIFEFLKCFQCLLGRFWVFSWDVFWVSFYLEYTFGLLWVTPLNSFDWLFWFQICDRLFEWFVQIFFFWIHFSQSSWIYVKLWLLITWPRLASFFFGCCHNVHERGVCVHFTFSFLCKYVS